MAGFFSRLFKVAEANAHAAVDHLEDPIKMTEQGIRDLKRNLQAAMVSLAQVKSLAIRLHKEGDDHKKRAAEYERKAMLLLKRMEAGEMGAADAERLATAALEKKEEAVRQAGRVNGDHQTQQRMADQLQAKVDDLKRKIARYENDLVTLRAARAHRLVDAQDQPAARRRRRQRHGGDAREDEAQGRGRGGRSPRPTTSSTTSGAASTTTSTRR